MSCPICRKDIKPDYKPFCSKRCADVDLGKWLGGDYSFASQDAEDQQEALETLEQLSSRPH
ncbi:DNA gyrase inhibitor YacG [uncultured Shimia sp.]|uniref:DNA gyrase inhibitor YacG n=1 Tax=uncultured Shimia sp. TaxID=573152 RepID=UPI002620E77A|nr:DNA gyrase inhibitor YacG [uncultured Shimia sp.]